MDKPARSLQRFSLALDKKGEPTLSYDMQGDVVWFDDHRRALNTERSLANDRVASVERAQTFGAKKSPGKKSPEKTKETLSLHATLRALRASVEVLRSAHGWTDGDIIFAADLTSEDRSDATAPPSQEAKTQ